jgi:hypothetical protein
VAAAPRTEAMRISCDRFKAARYVTTVALAAAWLLVGPMTVRADSLQCATTPWYRHAVPRSPKKVRDADVGNPILRAKRLRANMLAAAESAKTASALLQQGSDPTSIVQNMELPRYFRTRLVEAAKRKENVRFIAQGSTPEGTTFRILVPVSASCPSGEVQELGLRDDGRRDLANRLLNLANALSNAASRPMELSPRLRSNIAIDAFLFEDNLTAEAFEGLTGPDSVKFTEETETPGNHLQPAIAGDPGFETRSYPGAAALFWDREDRAFCSGVLVGLDAILTAAHCFCPVSRTACTHDERHAGSEGDLSQPRGLKAYFLGEEVMTIASVVIYPGFDFPSGDVALVRLEKKVERIAPANLSFTLPPLPTRMHAIGYGRRPATPTVAEARNIKRAAPLDVQACESLTLLGVTSGSKKPISQLDDLVCWRFAESGGLAYGNICDGDSGGPVAVQMESRFVVVGIAMAYSGPDGCSTGSIGLASSLNQRICQFLRAQRLAQIRDCNAPTFEANTEVDTFYALRSSLPALEAMQTDRGTFTGKAVVWRVKGQGGTKRSVLINVNAGERTQLSVEVVVVIGDTRSPGNCLGQTSVRHPAPFYSCVLTVPPGADVEMLIKGLASEEYQAAATW